MVFNRIIRTLLMAAALILAGGLWAPPTPWINTGVAEDAFWISKAFDSKKYDVVLAGDSRVLKGLSPGAMSPILPRERIINFAFDHNAYTKAYLEACEALINKSASWKAVILGISPQSLTREAADRNGFSSLRKRGRFDRFTMRYLSPHLAFFNSYNFYYFWDLLHANPKIKYYQHHYADGWVASRREPEDPGYQIALYRGRFDNNIVSPFLTQQLFDYIQRWRRQGIEVFGARLPTSAAMLHLENQQSGFNQDVFVCGFEKAGGTWLQFNLTGYHSYDGSHLREDAARQLSVKMAREIEQVRSEGAAITDSIRAKGRPGYGS